MDYRGEMLIAHAGALNAFPGLLDLTKKGLQAEQIERDQKIECGLEFVN